MSIEAWGDENPDDAYQDSWMDSAIDAGWLDPSDFSAGSLAIMREREEQEEREGYTSENDDAYTTGQLARAATCYVYEVAWFEPSSYGQRSKHLWPWKSEFWKPKNPRADLIRAGALIAAEIDRIDRAAIKDSTT